MWLKKDISIGLSLGVGGQVWEIKLLSFAFGCVQYFEYIEIQKQKADTKKPTYRALQHEVTVCTVITKFHQAHCTGRCASRFFTPELHAAELISPV
ncbi:hypothetical protein FKM82_013281 [Ascaphus truei]